ncbi:MAG: HisA/HisF-related TIM barrel protein [bacterium]|nr:HisA/HisF-related TIM barrel protein [bacterium]MDE0353311.1 HisA/HisF-related TIM barrel protein [bacterium]
MDLYARVNILEGRAVRLGRGSLDDVISLDADPINRARGWADMGVDRLLVVDLDAAAYRSYRNRPLIDRMLSALDVPIVVAGGIRSEREAARLIEQGAWKVTMGTAAIETPTMVWDLCRDFPGRMMVSLDVLGNEELVTEGWTSDSGRFMEEVMLEMASCGVSGFFVTDARRDVLSERPNLDILRTALEYIDEPVVASGGVRNVDDLRALTSIDVEGRSLAGVVVGREVTEGRFTVGQAKAVLGGPGAPLSRVLQLRVVIPCSDLGRSIDFYQSTLGFARIETAASHGPGADGATGTRVLLDVGVDSVLELVPEGDPGQVRYPCRLVFVVDDAEARRDQVEALGHTTGPAAGESPGAFEVEAPDGVTVIISEPLGVRTP